MSRWFRMYDEILDDPKVQKLAPGTFKMWVNVLALCSRCGGRLPPVSDCAFAFRETEASVSSAFHALQEAGLLVTVDETFQPRNWRKRQYKSDTSTERVRSFRKRSRNVTETAPDTETDTDTLAKANAADPEKVMFDQGIAYLGTCGVKAERARGMLGRWKRDNGAGAVIEALGAAQRHGAIDPIPFIEQRFRARAKTYDRDRITV